MADPALVCTGAVEGPVDEAVLRRVVLDFGIHLVTTYIANGKPHLLRQLRGYNNAAHHSPWIVLVDLDHSAGCAPPVLAEWLPDPAPRMCFRIAVRAAESWLMADRESMGRYLGVPLAHIPQEPEQLDDPKQTLVDIARRSRRAAIREGIVPRQESGRQVGPGYTLLMVDYAGTLWRPAAAELHADSLRRFRARLPGAIG